MNKVQTKINMRPLSFIVLLTAYVGTASVGLAQQMEFNGPIPLYEASGQCQSCSKNATNFSSVYMLPPSQPTGVSSGACRPCLIGVDCATPSIGEKRWGDATSIDFEPLYHGEYIGPVRLPAMLEYKVRVNDEITFTYIPKREQVNIEYRLMVGDIIAISSSSDDNLKQEKIQVQPDGKIHLRTLAAPVEASGKTIPQLRRDLEVLYGRLIKIPAINIEPVTLNTALADLLDAVNGPFAAGGRFFVATVNPDGRIQLPRLGGIYVLGMSLEEIRREVNLRYEDRVVGIEVEPRLTRQAQHFVFVFGKVAQPGRFELLGPTTALGGLALAGGPVLGANTRQVVVMRRAEDWRLVATMLDLRGAQLGKRPIPSDEIWLRDSDLIIVPDQPISRANDAAQQIFTNGIYRVIPFQIQAQ
ncbi:MAG: polysaccharide biosynthesis/export family protein [Pirellula sp.]|jgi:polysaccharide export outer membrane protein